jgi:tRNA threonylcarbamoyladenosine biosynthesis protein TsaE
MDFDVHQTGSVRVFLPEEHATLELGARLARALQPGLKIYLRGELGAGKTTLVRGLLRAMGYAGAVRSPTYALVEVYGFSSLYLHHFDFYRLKDPTEWDDAGFRDIFGGNSVCLVEWPEKVGDVLPRADVEIVLEHEDSGRTAHLYAHTETGTRCLQQVIG